MCSNNRKPILVQNPETKRFCNIEPLFYIINEKYNGDFYMAANCFDQAIELLACGNTNDIIDNSLVDFHNIMQTMFDFRNAIKNISEFKEERRG